MRSAEAQRVATAVRSDPATSTTEIVGFLGSGSDRLFGSLIMPMGEPRASVLMCSSLYAETARNYRREVILARELAVRGIASLRYHYRGTGYSDGDPAALAFPSMCADATTALAQLRERCPGLPIAYLGTRLGALVAARMARSAPEAPVLLWDPIADATTFFKDAIKARKAGGMIAGEPDVSAPASEQDLWGPGFLDSLGYRLPVGLRNSLEGVSLVDCLGDSARAIMVISVVPGYEPTSQAETVAKLLRTNAGLKVDLRRLDGRLGWWTSRDSWDPDEDHPPTREVIARSSEWLERRLTSGSIS